MMVKVQKLPALVVILNVVRYLLAAPLESAFIFKPLFGEMQRNAGYFRTEFTTWDWATSYVYNFMMWLTAEWIFVLLNPRLRGNIFVRSLKAYGLMLLFFVSVSGIYMNHYSHPKAFYFWNCLDAVMMFALVALANALLYPAFFKPEGSAKAV